MEAETILQEMHKGTLNDAQSDHQDFNLGSDSDHHSGQDHEHDENPEVDGNYIDFIIQKNGEFHFHKMVLHFCKIDISFRQNLVFISTTKVNSGKHRCVCNILRWV